MKTPRFDNKLIWEDVVRVKLKVHSFNSSKLALCKNLIRFASSIDSVRQPNIENGVYDAGE